jgi:hypothetical protein
MPINLAARDRDLFQFAPFDTTRSPSQHSPPCKLQDRGIVYQLNLPDSSTMNNPKSMVVSNPKKDVAYRRR